MQGSYLTYGILCLEKSFFSVVLAVVDWTLFRHAVFQNIWLKWPDLQ
jgi:hypothetical protein